MYVTTNFKTKTALKRAVKAGEYIGLLHDSPLVNPPSNGYAYVEGPWYPMAHTWYAQVTMRNGQVVAVK